MSIDKMILIGYWYSEDKDDSEYPRPQDLIDEAYYERNYDAKGALQRYLSSGIVCNHYRGFSTCRICGKHLGSFERHDGVYIWPDQLEHYVVEHNVKLPDEFVKHVNYKMYMTDVEADDTFWKNWSKIINNS